MVVLFFGGHIYSILPNLVGENFFVQLTGIEPVTPPMVRRHQARIEHLF
jgi:hypothetical protein